VSYLKVLELDARHSIALGFLGIVYHLTNQVDKAIVKYHEVCVFDELCLRSHSGPSQALSIDPINSHILELLNMALDASIISTPSTQVIDTEFKKAAKDLKLKYSRLAGGKGKEKAAVDVAVDAAPDEMNIG
jgi:anaphase-promoting complex subunit 6